MNGFEILKQRGFIAQMTHEAEMDKLFAEKNVIFYNGYDPTADSLHIGHYVTFMAAAWLQRAGHVPIILMGGGTGMVGDPDKADEMRPLMSLTEIDNNIERFKTQAAQFIDFSDDKAIMVNNGDWLRQLNYTQFIREYGIHFSVNRMLATDKYKTKFEGSGLNFFELNYVVMQAYDFLELNRRFGCVVQAGGSDQWSNIVAGVDLIRRVDGKDAYGFTYNLLLKGDGQKMGKTTGGVTWLDANKTSPHDFYQYFRNTQDTVLRQYLCMLTFLPLEQIDELTATEGEALNKAKEVLAYEVTKIVHGKQIADEVSSVRIPNLALSKDIFGGGINILDLLVHAGLVPSKSEARRNVQQGGIMVDGKKIDDATHVVELSHFTDGGLIVQKGKKTFLKITTNTEE
ncbi:MAG: tyrosine--tRNA ligase [Defluviitaleaceae bacterium]|nr:tyrosine--tRNA ligase [Defluviitaleaceae bacterium]